MTERNEDLLQEIVDFVDSLDANEDGKDEFGRYLVRYEGFTEECYEGMEEECKTTDEIVVEILEDWDKANVSEYGSNLEMYTSDWSGDVFYAIYELE